MTRPAVIPRQIDLRAPSAIGSIRRVRSHSQCAAVVHAVGACANPGRSIDCSRMVTGAARRPVSLPDHDRDARLRASHVVSQSASQRLDRPVVGSGDRHRSQALQSAAREASSPVRPRRGSAGISLSRRSAIESRAVRVAPGEAAVRRQPALRAAREHAPSRKLVARCASGRCRGLPVGAASDVHCRDRRWAISPSRSSAVRIRSNFRSVSQSASRPGGTRLTKCSRAGWIVRSHSARLLERLVLYDLHFNYHSAHHRWPQCPSRHLPLVHEQYLAGHVPLEPQHVGDSGCDSCGRSLVSKVSVYYNSACPVCNAGIEAQRRRMQSCNVDVEWIDIHRNPERLTETGASRSSFASDCTWSTMRE